MESPTIGKLAEALSKAQGMMESAKKDSVNPHFKSKYADQASIIDALREPLSKNGLSYVQFMEIHIDGRYLTTKIMHSSGEWISGNMPLLFAKNDMQGLGGALTYASRYSLSAFFGVAQEDDDGNTAVNIKPHTSHTTHTPIQAVDSHPAAARRPSEAQLKRLFAICKSRGIVDLRRVLFADFGVAAPEELSIEQYRTICDAFEKLPTTGPQVVQQKRAPEQPTFDEDLPPMDLSG